MMLKWFLHPDKNKILVETDYLWFGFVVFLAKEIVNFRWMLAISASVALNNLLVHMWSHLLYFKLLKELIEIVMYFIFPEWCSCQQNWQLGSSTTSHKIALCSRTPWSNKCEFKFLNVMHQINNDFDTNQDSQSQAQCVHYYLQSVVQIHLK